jgi:hypothetical protein
MGPAVHGAATAALRSHPPSKSLHLCPVLAETPSQPLRFPVWLQLPPKPVPTLLLLPNLLCLQQLLPFSINQLVEASAFPIWNLAALEAFQPPPLDDRVSRIRSLSSLLTSHLRRLR